MAAAPFGFVVQSVSVAIAKSSHDHLVAQQLPILRSATGRIQDCKPMIYNCGNKSLINAYAVNLVVNQEESHLLRGSLRCVMSSQQFVHRCGAFEPNAVQRTPAELVAARISDTIRGPSKAFAPPQEGGKWRSSSARGPLRYAGGSPPHRVSNPHALQRYSNCCNGFYSQYPSYPGYSPGKSRLHYPSEVTLITEGILHCDRSWRWAAPGFRVWYQVSP